MTPITAQDMAEDFIRSQHSTIHNEGTFNAFAKEFPK